MTKSKPFLFRTSTIALSICLAGILFLLNCKYSSHPGQLTSHSQPNEVKDTASQSEVQNTFLNVTKIAKKSKAIVDAYLGPTNYHTTVNPGNAPCPCEQYNYKDGKIEIVYMKDVADWITVNNMNTVEFNPESILKALGIPFSNPVIQSKEVIKWNDFNGYDQLSAFPDGKGGVSYVFLKAITH